MERGASVTRMNVLRRFVQWVGDAVKPGCYIYLATGPDSHHFRCRGRVRRGKGEGFRRQMARHGLQVRTYKFHRGATI